MENGMITDQVAGAINDPEFYHILTSLVCVTPQIKVVVLALYELVTKLRKFVLLII
jgi:hypothetical protein